MSWLLLLALTCTWSVAALLAYVDAHREIDALLDAHLRQSARLLVAQAELDLDEIDVERDEGEDYRTEVAFQVRTVGGIVLARSANAPRGMFAAGTHGFADVDSGGRTWRVYSLPTEDGALVVHFAEDHVARARIASHMARRALLPMLAAIPVLGLLVWWVVGRTLRPVDRLGEEIARRGPDDLAPLAPGPLPAELAPLVLRLDEWLARIRDSLDSERRFTSHAAHELRTPVAGLRAQAEVASSTRDPVVRAAALAHCIEACDRLARLVSQLLLLARADEPDALGEARPCRLDTIARAVLTETAPVAAESGVTVELDAPGEATVQGDAALLEALVRNLLDNAIRHGGRTVRLSLTTDAATTVLEVEDDGPGVPAEALSRLGRPFYRADETRGTGSGLGLSIVARIAELHHARLAFAKSGLGGLRVSIRFAG